MKTDEFNEILVGLGVFILFGLTIYGFLLKAAEINWYHDNYELSF